MGKLSGIFFTFTVSQTQIFERFDPEYSKIHLDLSRNFGTSRYGYFFLWDKFGYKTFKILDLWDKTGDMKISGFIQTMPSLSVCIINFEL